MDLLQLLLVLFGRDNKKRKWKIEYEYSIYKVYDANKKLAGYFFPEYGSVQQNHHQRAGRSEQEHEDQPQGEDKIIERMNKTHEKVRTGGNLMVPMLKLNYSIIQKVWIWIILLKP